MATRKPTDDIDEVVSDTSIDGLRQAVLELSSRLSVERSARRTSLIANGFIILILFAMLAGLWTALGNDRHTRHQGQVATCAQTNLILGPINDIIVGFAMPRPGQVRSGSEQVMIDREVASRVIDVRLCSAAGIRAFYAHDYKHAYVQAPQATALLKKADEAAG